MSVTYGQQLYAASEIIHRTKENIFLAHISATGARKVALTYASCEGSTPYHHQGELSTGDGGRGDGQGMGWMGWGARPAVGTSDVEGHPSTDEVSGRTVYKR